MDFGDDQDEDDWDLDQLDAIEQQAHEDHWRATQRSVAGQPASRHNATRDKQKPPLPQQQQQQQQQYTRHEQVNRPAPAPAPASSQSNYAQVLASKDGEIATLRARANRAEVQHREELDRAHNAGDRVKHDYERQLQALRDENARLTTQLKFTAQERRDVMSVPFQSPSRIGARMHDGVSPVRQPLSPMVDKFPPLETASGTPTNGAPSLTSRRVRKRRKLGRNEAADDDFDDEFGLGDLPSPRSVAAAADDTIGAQPRTGSAPQTPQANRVRHMSQYQEFDIQDVAPQPLSGHKVATPRPTQLDRLAICTSIVTAQKVDRGISFLALDKSWQSTKDLTSALASASSAEKDDDFLQQLVLAFSALLAEELNNKSHGREALREILILINAAIDSAPSQLVSAILSRTDFQPQTIPGALQDLLWDSADEPASEDRKAYKYADDVLALFIRLCEGALELDDSVQHAAVSQLSAGFLCVALTDARFIALRPKLLRCLALASCSEKLLFVQPFLPGWIAQSLTIPPLLTPTFEVRSDSPQAIRKHHRPNDTYVPQPHPKPRRLRPIQHIIDRPLSQDADIEPDVGKGFQNEWQRHALFVNTLQCLYAIARSSSTAKEAIAKDRACITNLILRINLDIEELRRSQTFFTLLPEDVDENSAATTVQDKGRSDSTRAAATSKGPKPSRAIPSILQRAVWQKDRRPRAATVLELAVRLYAFLVGDDDGAILTSHWSPQTQPAYLGPPLPIRFSDSNGLSRTADGAAHTSNAPIAYQLAQQQRQDSNESGRSAYQTAAATANLASSGYPRSRRQLELASGRVRPRSAAPRAGVQIIPKGITLSEPAPPSLNHNECRAAHIVSLARLAFMDATDDQEPAVPGDGQDTSLEIMSAQSLAYVAAVRALPPGSTLSDDERTSLLRPPDFQDGGSAGDLEARVAFNAALAHLPLDFAQFVQVNDLLNHTASVPPTKHKPHPPLGLSLACIDTARDLLEMAVSPEEADEIYDLMTTTGDP
ncbi:hypothetical protein PYCC9005_004344 [Savitreella phatthalungensis]